MSANALPHVNESAARLLAATRSSPFFGSLRDGSVTLKGYGDWLAQTTHYCAVTAEVLAMAARSMASAGGDLARIAAEISVHGIEEGEENPVILSDLSALGVELSACAPIPPVQTYITMVRSISQHIDWAVGILGVVRTLELLAHDCATPIYQSLSQSPHGSIRGALRFVDAHRDEAAHLERVERLIKLAPRTSDYAITWAANQACLFYEGLLAHLDVPASAPLNHDW
jgi:thiaminase